MWIFIAAALGACTFIVTWSIGLNADVSGLIALAFLSVGILGQMSSRQADRQRP